MFTSEQLMENILTFRDLENGKFKVEVEVTIKNKQYCLNKELESMHQIQLKSLYEFNKTNGDLLLIPTNFAIDGDSKNDEIDDDELKQSEIDEITVGDDENAEIVKNQNGIRISSLLLKNASKVFQTMLNSDMKESKEKVTQIPSENLKNIDDLVYFIVTGNLRDHNVNELQLLRLSHLFQLKALNYACLDRLIANLSASNLVQTITAFDKLTFLMHYTDINNT